MGLFRQNGAPAALTAAATRNGRARPVGYASPADVELPLTAAATRVKSGNAGQLKRLSQPWQRRALSYYEMTPEAHFAATYQGNMLSQVRLYPAKLEGTERKEVEDENIVEYLSRVHDPGSPERSELQRSFGRLMLLTGEGYMLATGTGDSDQPEQWEFVSTEELRVDNEGRLRRFAAPGGQGVVYEAPEGEEEAFEPLDKDEAVAYRMWRPSPKHTQMADSPMQGVLDLFEELLLLQMAVRARVRSRLAAAGIAIIADSVTLPAAPDARADHRNAAEDPMLAMMIQHMMRPIADEGSASAVVPFLLRATPEEGQSVKDLIAHIRFSDPNETYRESGLRAECIERIATGMDFPAEILKGTGDMTHWNAWQVDEQVAKTLIFPVCALLCANMTDSYFRPALRDAGVTDWQDYVIWYDPAAIIAHPDQSANARELYDRGELTGEMLRDAHGWDGKQDKPKDDEVIRWMALDKRDSVLFTTGEPAPPPQILGPDGQPIAPEEGPDLIAEKDGAATAKQPPPEPVVASLPERASWILGMCEMALESSRAKAGARVRSKASQYPDLFIPHETVTNAGLVAAIGPSTLTAVLKQSPTELVAGGAAGLQFALRRANVSDEWALELQEQIEAHAARTLFEEAPTLPPSFVNLVTRTDRA